VKRRLSLGLAALLFFSWAAAEKFYSEVWYELASGPLPGFAGIYYDYKTGVYVVRMVPRRDNGLLKYARGKADRVGARLEVPEALLMRVVRLIEDAGGFRRPNSHGGGPLQLQAADGLVPGLHGSIPLHRGGERNRQQAGLVA